MAQDEGREATCEQQAADGPKWLVMIYLAGDNNLSANSIAVLQDLISAHPPRDQVRVVACFDPNTPRPRGARYVVINSSDDNTRTPCWPLHNDLVPFDGIPGHPVTAPDFCETEDPPEPLTITEPVAREGLSRFLQFALRRYWEPGMKTMLILYGHGSAVAGNTFLADDNPPSFLRLTELAEVMARHFGDPSGTPKLDILACDNCMMNGIEIAHQLRQRVNYLLGSQGLMLAVGWPFRKIIKAIVQNVQKGYKEPKDIAHTILRVCARNLIDFSLMDRSSEQAVCDLTTLSRPQNVVTAVRRLSAAMQDGLEFDHRGELLYPAIRDAIWLARHEAQGFWAETFVDLYDFCELLLRHCNEAISRPVALIERLLELGTIQWVKKNGPDPGEIKEALVRADPGLRLFRRIAERCWDVLKEFEGEHKFVNCAYYVGPDLQYSHGVSIYFPWTLPQDPIIFEPVGGTPGRGSGGNYGLSWVSFDKVGRPPDDYILRTAFDEYKNYDFARNQVGAWAAFLEKFFRATLRNVRRFDFEYKEGTDSRFVDPLAQRERERFVPPADVNLQKSGSDNDSEEDCICPTIKNYPRRFYLSPADCQRRCPLPPHAVHTEDAADPKDPCASYLGWNIRGLLASVIKLYVNTSSVADDQCSAPVVKCLPRDF
ncbi:MAG: clostripain-related cysteine peptidase [Acidobacteriota bacterium]|nr:clostripain-related cysteine peptidase [Acidobacteriota bacterium]